MILFYFIAALLAVVIGIPTLIYFCMKLGTFGYYRGKSIAERERRCRQDTVHNKNG